MTFDRPVSKTLAVSFRFLIFFVGNASNLTDILPQYIHDLTSQ